MAKVKIVTDSACDLPLELIQELNIESIPVNVIFDNEIFNQYEISLEDYFSRLKSGEMPTTGVPAPKRFKAAFDNALEESNDVIVFTVTGKLSGVNSSANMVAKNFFDDRLTIIDTQTATLESGLIVYLAAKMAQEGASKTEILDYVNTTLVPKSQLFGIVDTLKYLKKGGRIGTVQWLMGSILSIKPIIRFKDGLIDSPGKVRGSNHALKLFRKIAKKVLENRIVDTVFVAHSNVKEKALSLYNFIKELPNAPKDLQLLQIGPVISTHTGPGAIGLAWIGDYQSEWL